MVQQVSCRSPIEPENIYADFSPPLWIVRPRELAGIALPRRNLGLPGTQASEVMQACRTARSPELNRAPFWTFRKTCHETPGCLVFAGAQSSFEARDFNR